MLDSGDIRHKSFIYDILLGGIKLNQFIVQVNTTYNSTLSQFIIYRQELV